MSFFLVVNNGGCFVVNFFVGDVVNDFFFRINFFLLMYEGFVMLSKEILRIVINVLVSLGKFVIIFFIRKVF